MATQKLGLGMLTALVVGNMVGSGAYMLPSTLSKIGSISLLSWLLTCIGAIALALVFGRLSRAIPKTGGPYAYTKVSFGSFIGFQTSLCYWTSAWIGNAAIVVACVGYLHYFFPALNNPFYSCVTGVAMVWIFTLVNIGGVRNAGLIQSITAVIKLLPILVVILFGWFYFHPSNILESINVTTPRLTNLQATFAAATLTLWGFIGIESATVPAGSAKNPAQTIGRATIIGTIIVAVIYLLSSAVVMGMIPNSVLQGSTAPFADAAELIFGQVGASVIAIGAIISCLGALNGWILLQGQIAMAAADDGLFPFAGFFARKNKHGVPANATIVTSMLISVLLFATAAPDLVSQFQQIIVLATSMALFMYFYVGAASLVLGRKRLLDWTWVGISLYLLACGYAFWAIFSVGKDVIYFELMFILLTFLLYGVTIHPKREIAMNSEVNSITMH